MTHPLSCLCGRRAATRTAATNSCIFAGLLRPGALSTPLDTSTPKGRTACDRGRHIVAVEARRPVSAACRCASCCAPVPSRARSPRRCAALKQKRARQALAARAAASAHAPAALERRGQAQLLADPPTSLCSASGRNRGRSHRPAACDGMPRDRDAAAAHPAPAAASCAACAGLSGAATRRNTKPMASHRPASAALTASALVMPQILIHMRRSECGTSKTLPRAARPAASSCAASTRADHRRSA